MIFLKLHILIRLIGDGLPACRDSKLFIKDLHFDEVPVRIYLPRLPSASKRREVIFFHGGYDTFKQFTNLCICNNSCLLYISGYHLFPERKYPAQTLDCLTATVHFLKTAENYRVDPDSITVCGDSAGGTFTASICQELVNIRVTPKIHAQVRIYPLLQALNFNLPSHQKNAFIAFLSQECTVCFILKYLNKDCSMNEAILAGSHVPKSMNLKYRKWINPDLITKIFKLGYKPPLPTSFLPQVHEEMNCLRQDFPTVSRRCWVLLVTWHHMEEASIVHWDFLVMVFSLFHHQVKWRTTL
uniref:Alpha/beta hydrolase fold-3 domain-containing protein n=1 Tax=Buteo japonicus TaxID=224669 RepID=A0A8C0AQM6_9AVES